MTDLTALNKYPCAGCGAQAEWNPAKGLLVCPFCGTSTPFKIDRETGAIQDSERNFYTAPEVTTLLDLAGLERLAVAGDLALAIPAREAEPSYFFRARAR